MKRTFSVWIPGELASRNQAELVARTHRMAAASMKKKNTQKVALCCLGCKQIAWVPMEQYKLTMRIIRKDKRTDPDNVIGGNIKYVLDGLQVADIVAGDGWNNVMSISVSWDTDKDRPGIYVTVEEV